MTTAEPITLNVTPELRQRIEYLAKTHGYETVNAYALAILEQFVEEPSEEEILEDIRVSFREALSGQTIPIEDVLAELEAEDDE